MSPENTQKVYDAFPRLYRKFISPLEDSTTNEGLRIGDGWFKALWTLSQIIAHQASVVGLDPFTTSVREKFGGLQLNVEGGDGEIARWRHEVYILTAWICQACGHDNKAQLPELGPAPECSACGGDLA